MARFAASIGRSRWLLPYAVTPACRRGCLLIPARGPLAGSDRTHENRLRTGRLPARLADTIGLFGRGFTARRFADILWLRQLPTSRGLPAGREPLWPQPVY